MTCACTMLHAGNVIRTNKGCFKGKFWNDKGTICPGTSSTDIDLGLANSFTDCLQKASIAGVDHVCVAPNVNAFDSATYGMGLGGLRCRGNHGGLDGWTQLPIRSPVQDLCDYTRPEFGCQPSRQGLNDCGGILIENRNAVLLWTLYNARKLTTWFVLWGHVLRCMPSHGCRQQCVKQPPPVWQPWHAHDCMMSC